MSNTKNYAYYEQYESAKTNLQRETAALLAERNQLQSRFAANDPQRYKNRPNYSQSASITPVALEKRSDSTKTQEVVKKLHEIIKLCKEEGSLSNEEMKEVIKVENQVLNYLQKSNQTIPKLVNPHSEQTISHPQNRDSFQTHYQLKNQQPTHYQHEPQFRISQPQLRISQENYSSQSKFEPPEIIKPTQDIDRSNPVLGGQTWGKQQRPPSMSEDAIQIIAEIERKALGEIIHLQQERDSIKKERDSLFGQLQKVKAQSASNQQNTTQRMYQQQQKLSRTKLVQIQRLIQQNKALRTSLYETDHLKQQSKLLREENQSLIQRIEFLQAAATQNYREARKNDVRQTYPQYNESRVGLIHGQYDSQIAVYQNELRRSSSLINQLRSRLANIPGLQQLHQQGERIRRETTELLQMKARGGATSHDSALIRQLQERLQEEEQGKVLFLQELKSFKQRYRELEEQNRALKRSKVSFDPVPRVVGSTPQKESSPSRGIIKKRKDYFGDYQQTLNQMKRALY